MKALTIALLLVATLTIFAAPAAAEDATPLSGNWLFTIETSTGIITAEASFTVQQDTVQGTMNTPSGQVSISGSWDSNAVRIYAVTDADILFTFVGVRDDGIMSGALELLGDSVGRWSARRQ